VLSAHTGGVTSVAFNPRSTRLLTTSVDSDARLWRVRDGTPIAALRIHGGAIRDGAFSADGRWIVTAGPRLAGVWRAGLQEGAPGQFLFFLRGHEAPISNVAFSPDGWRILTAGPTASANPRAPQRFSVREYNCAVCAKVGGLVRLANARLRAIKPVG